MKAVRVIEGSSRFEYGEAERPVLEAGTVRVRIEAAFLPTYFDGLPKGGWLTPARPFTPGQCAVGVIEELDPAITQFKPGDRVYCDMYIEGPGPESDQAFIGCFGINAPAARHLARWPNGTFAEEFVGPEACFTKLPVGIAPEILCRVGWFATALAGFQRGGFKPGQVVAIHGGSGLLGASAALVACAMGAAQVRLIGRRPAQMAEVASLDRRIVVEVPGDTTPVDFVLDCAGGAAVEGTQALIRRLTRFGCVTFTGALSAPLPVETASLMRNGLRLVGSFWFDKAQTRETIALIASGALDLTPFRATTFPLARIQEAMVQSLTLSGGLSHVALKP